MDWVDKRYSQWRWDAYIYSKNYPHQGKGIAGAVISEIEKYSKSKTKINTLKMLIKANNVNSLKMAHKLGYQEVEKLTSWKNGEVKWIVCAKKF